MESFLDGIKTLIFPEDFFKRNCREKIDGLLTKIKEVYDEARNMAGVQD